MNEEDGKDGGKGPSSREERTKRKRREAERMKERSPTRKVLSRRAISERRYCDKLFENSRIEKLWKTETKGQEGCPRR